MFGKMKLFVAGVSLASLVMAVSPVVRADEAPPAPKQQGGDKGGKPQRDPTKMIDEQLAKLNLTDDQKKKIEPIETKFKDDMHAIMADESIKPEDKKAKGRDTMMAFWKDVNDILTPDQQAQLKKMRDERKAARDGGGKKGPGDQGPHKGGDKGPPPGGDKGAGN